MTTRHLFPLFFALTAALLLSGCHSEMLLKNGTASTTTPSIAKTTLVSATVKPVTTPNSMDPQEPDHVQDRDLWDRVRNSFSMEQPENKRITQHIKWLKKHPSYLKRLQKRSRPYIHFILEQAKKRGLPTELVLLPAVESAYRPFAYSHGRAAGLWQFIPATGRHFNLKQNWWYDGRRDVVASTHAAFDYLEALAKRFKGDWHLALAAYQKQAQGQAY